MASSSGVFGSAPSLATKRLFTSRTGLRQRYSISAIRGMKGVSCLMTGHGMAFTGDGHWLPGVVQNVIVLGFPAAIGAAAARLLV